MHEVAAMRGVVARAIEAMRAAGAARVVGVHLLLGASGHLSEEGARQHFATFAQGTPAANADLTITWLPATYQCFTCLRQFESTEPAESIACPDCGGVALEIAHEDTCALIGIDVTGDVAGDVNGQADLPASKTLPGLRIAAETSLPSSERTS